MTPFELVKAAGAKRYCVADEATWRSGGCPVCSGPGVLAQDRNPPGWPVLSVDQPPEEPRPTRRQR